MPKATKPLKKGKTLSKPKKLEKKQSLKAMGPDLWE
jgi:hypothetical protein